jgi:hypothetical protein
MNTKSKIAFANGFVGPLLTRDDIAALLVAYYGAVALDEVRVEHQRWSLPRKYDREHWQEYREDHLGQLRRLLDTLSYVSQETLAKLTVLAATRKPTVVREVLIELLTLGALAYHGDERMFDAPEFFSTLVKEADRGARAPKDGEGIVERMMRWLDPVDPLRISRECGYKKSMSPQIWR